MRDGINLELRNKNINGVISIVINDAEVGLRMSKLTIINKIN